MTTNSYTALIKGKTVTFTHIGATAKPLFKDVTSVSVIPFTKDGDIVAVHLKHRGLDLPGGHVEPGETEAEQTIHREAMEEAGITVTHPVLIEVIESDYYEHQTYMLLYSAFVHEFHEYEPGDYEMSEGREIVSQDEFIERYEAGNKKLMKQAIQSAWQILKIM
ncbi:MAG TPA: NUDIX domain-containing protein [Candidatus Saccharimonadales bacterium]